MALWPLWTLHKLWEFIWGFNTRCYTLVQGFCFFWLFLMGCKELTAWKAFTNYYETANHGTWCRYQQYPPTNKPQDTFLLPHCLRTSATVQGCPERMLVHLLVQPGRQCLRLACFGCPSTPQDWVFVCLWKCTFSWMWATFLEFLCFLASFCFHLQ